MISFVSYPAGRHLLQQGESSFAILVMKGCEFIRMARLIGRQNCNSPEVLGFKLRRALSLILAFSLIALNFSALTSLQVSAQEPGGNARSEPSAQGEKNTETITGAQTSGASGGTDNSPSPATQPPEIPPGEIQPTETPSADPSGGNVPSADAASEQTIEMAQPEPAPSGQAPIPNADAMPNSTGTFGAVEIPGYSEAMGAAQNPGQSKANKQLIESLRDVFPINGNPLKDLFTPQPQFVTPQTLMNPQPSVPKAGEANPLKGLFTPQPQYITPQTLLNPEPNPPAGELNHFKGVFTAQPQYPTPQTLMNPHPLPRYYVKERMPDHFFEKDASGKQAQTDKVETPLGPSKSSDGSANPNNHPLRQAMLLMNSAHETDAIAIMDRLLAKYPGNFQARYVKAVALVRLRRFGDARDEYKTILQFSSDVALKKLAQEGMAKLAE